MGEDAFDVPCLHPPENRATCDSTYWWHASWRLSFRAQWKLGLLPIFRIVREYTRTKNRAELSSNGSQLKLRTAGLTPHFHAELLWNGQHVFKPNSEIAFPLWDGDKTRSQLAFATVLQPSLCFPAMFVVIGSLSPFYLVLDVLPWQYWTHCWYCRIVATRYGSIDAMTATQLFTNTTWFSLPRDIGTPRHWNPESMHREARGHWNLGTLEPRVHREGNGHRPENRQRAPSQGTALTCSGTSLASPAVSPLRVSLPIRSWRLRRPGWVHVGFRCVSLFPKCF